MAGSGGICEEPGCGDVASHYCRSHIARQVRSDLQLARIRAADAEREADTEARRRRTDVAARDRSIEVLERRIELADAALLTSEDIYRGHGEHQRGYEGPCFCNLCESYGAEDGDDG